MTPEENNKKLAEIEKMLDEIKATKNNERFGEIMEALKTVSILVPILIDDPDKAKKLEEEARAKGEMLALTPDIKTRPILVTTKEGESFIGVYTSPGQIPDKVQKNGILSMPFAHTLKYSAESKGQVLGVVVNPFSHNLVLKPNNTPQTTEKTEDKAAESMDIHALARQNVEYVLLPRAIYENGKEYFDSVTADLIFGLFKDQYISKSDLNPFTSDDFDVMSYGIRPDMDLISIGMPDKNMSDGSCSRIYITYNLENNTRGYYMIVRKSGGFKLVFIDSKGHNRDLGDAPSESMELTTILEKEDERNHE